MTGRQKHLLGGSIFGDSLGTLRDGMLGEFSRKNKTNSSLNLSGRKSGFLVVTDQATSFRGDTLEDIVDERVHDRHGLSGNTSVRVNLLQHLVNVGGVRLNSLLTTRLSMGGGFLGGFLGGRHDFEV